jgi:oligoribonuclease NrnB/cAMP/cGMP phosphodiesterase (DHH superfamily)
MKTVCIYHSVDLDGWMSAGIVDHWQKSQWRESENKKEENESFDFLGYNYGQPIPDLSQYERVIMCDISFPLTEMDILFARIGRNFIWIDHHFSAIKDCGVKISNDEYISGYEGLRDTKFSACELTFKYFYEGQEIPEIVRLLGRYDCFGHKGTDEEQKVLEFQYGARQIISNYQEASDWLGKSFIHGVIEKIHEQGKAIYSYLCIEAKQSYKNGFRILFFEPTKVEGLIDGNGGTTNDAFIARKFICINKERFNPINFGIKYHEDGYDGCACFHYANNRWNFSIYNDNGKVDCSLIAKSFGGGGHKGASGFIVSDIQDILNRKL